jgi:hypothetical protein
MYATDETEVFALFFEHPVRFSQGTLLPWGIGAKCVCRRPSACPSACTFASLAPLRDQAS